MPTKYSPDFSELPSALQIMHKMTRGAGGHEEDDELTAESLITQTRLKMDQSGNLINPEAYPNYGAADFHSPVGDDPHTSDFFSK